MIVSFLFLSSLSLHAISLSEAEERALKASPAILLSQQEVQQNNARYSQAFLSWFPDVTFGSMIAVLQKSQKISSSQKQKHLFSNQFTLTQPIFSSNLLGDLRLSRLAKEGGKIGATMAANDALFQVRMSYLSMGLKKQEVALQEVRLAFLQQSFQDEEALLKTGSSTRLQVAKSKAALSQEVARKIDSQKDSAQARHQLALLLHLSPVEEKRLTFSRFPSVEDYPLLKEKHRLVEDYLVRNVQRMSPEAISIFSENEVQWWIQRAKQNRPEIKKSALLIQAAQAKTTQTRTQYLPEVSAFVDYGYYQPVNGQFFKQRNDWAGGIQLSWSLFDSFKKEMKSKEIASLRKAAQLSFDYESDKLEMTIRHDLHHIEENLFVYQVAQENLFLAQQTLEETEVQHASGAISDLQLQDARRFLAENEFGQTEAVVNLLQSYYQLLHDTGVPFPD